MLTNYAIVVFIAVASTACANSNTPKDIVLGNVGVMMKDMGTITVATSSWKHTFVIDMPTGNDLKLFMCKGNDEPAGTCIVDDDSEAIKIIKAMETDMIYRIELLNRTLLDSFESFKEWKRRPRNAPLSFIGKLSRSVFGMATMDDLQGVVNSANELIRRNGMMSSSMAKLSGNLASVIGISNSRYSTLKSMLNNTRGVIKEFDGLNRELSRYVAHFDKSQELLFVVRNVSFNFLDHLESVEYAIDNLKQGQLPSLLIPDHAIKSALELITKEGRKDHKLVHFPHTSIAYYRRRASFIARYQRDTSKLWLTLTIPYSVSPEERLYKISSFPIPMAKHSNHSTLIQDLPHFVVISPGIPRRYAVFSDVDLFLYCDHSKSHGFFHTDCNMGATYLSVEKETCMASLILDNSELIRSRCNFRVLKDSVKPTMFPLPSGRILVIGMNTITLYCKKRARRIEGCAFCIIDIPCSCEIESRSQIFSSHSVERCIDPRMVKITKRHLFNMISIRDYFPHLIDKTYRASATYTKEINAKLPEMKFSSVDSKFKEGYYANQLTMRQLTEKVKKNDKVFRDIYEQMLAGEIEVDASTDSPLFILRIAVMCFMVLLTIVNVVSLFVFMRKINRNIHQVILERNLQPNPTLSDTEED